MERLHQLLKDEQFKRMMAEIEQKERGRPFCRHGREHLFDVARIAWILCLEQGFSCINKECVYTAAFLHDIGRGIEYDDPAVDHAEAGARVALHLLLKYGFYPQEVDAIVEAIKEHRLPPEKCHSFLGRILAAADDYSRRCFECPARSECYKFKDIPSAEDFLY